MAPLKAHRVWVEQCEAVSTIRSRFGLKAAFDYIVGEKLLNFAAASSHNPNFARELPRFVSEVRLIFTPDEIEAQIAAIERAQREKDAEDLEDDDPLRETPVAAAERVRQFNLIKELLRASILGTA